MTTIQHNAERWGVARADDANRSRLVRIGDLVEALRRKAERAPADAARIVLDRLAEAALFKLRKDGDALLVGDSWHGMVRPRLFVDPNDRPGPDDPRWHKGASGARALARLTWCHAGRVDLDHGDAAWLAVLEADAVAASPELGWPVESRPVEVAPVATDPPAPRLVGVKVPGLPEPAELANELHELKGQKVRGPIQRLAEKYGCSRDTIERALREARQAATLRVGQFPKVGTSR